MLEKVLQRFLIVEYLNSIAFLKSLSSRYLSLAISSDSQISSSDTASVFSAVYSNPAGVDVAFSFFKQNQQALYDQ